MNSASLISEVREHIHKAKLNKAFEQLLPWLEQAPKPISTWADPVRNLLSQYNALEYNIICNTISQEAANVASSRINKSLLTILSSIEAAETETKEVQPSSSKNKKKHRPWVLVVLGLVLFVSISFLLPREKKSINPPSRITNDLKPNKAENHQVSDINKDKKEKEADAKAKREADLRERKVAADREANRKADADRKAQEAAKDEIGGLFSSGGGGGTTNKPGGSGATNGDPNSSNIGEKSFGRGDIGGGLGNRGVTNSPTLVENSLASGRVAVSLCVNSNGSVIASSVKVTQRGTTTTNGQLRNAAIRNAKKWGFSRGSVDRQCGTITYIFKVQ